MLITRKLIRSAIISSWQKYDYTESEKVALIFSNLDNVLIDQPELLSTTYDTLTQLSTDVDIIKRLEVKKGELL